MPNTRTLAALLAATVVLAACSGQKAGQPGGASPGSSSNAPADPIASAMSAAPEAVGKAATIVVPQPQDGSMKTLRQGSNGFTCMPDNPARLHALPRLGE